MSAASMFRTPTLSLASRREFLKRSAAAMALGAFGASAFSGRAMARTQVNWLGWQGYDSPLKTENFLENNGIDLTSAYLANNDEIVTQLAAHAAIDIVTPYMGFVPGLREAGLIQAPPGAPSSTSINTRWQRRRQVGVGLHHRRTG